MKLKYNEKQSGIYSIINTINDKVYVGKSKNLYQRKYQHFVQLKSGKHPNEHLQSSVNKYGVENFYYNVIEFCNEDVLGEREYYWIDHYDSNNRGKGYNIDIINEDGTTTRDWSSNKKMRKTIKENGGRVALKGADNPTSKTVYQYSLDGEYLGEFGSCHEAAKFLASPSAYTAISKVARKESGQSLGYQWRYEKFDSIAPYINNMVITNRKNAESQRKPIIGVNLETGEETKYESALAASKVLDLTLSNIARIASGKRKMSKKLNMTFRYLVD